MKIANWVYMKLRTLNWYLDSLNRTSFSCHLIIILIILYNDSKIICTEVLLLILYTATCKWAWNLYTALCCCICNEGECIEQEFL